MIKKLRVTVDGRSYDVTVEMSDDASVAPPTIAPPVLPPVSLAAPVAAPAPAAPAAPKSAAGANDVPSPLAGRVVAVNVQAGQAVNEGDHLLTLEAMKMNTLINAPRAGKVKEVKVAVSDAVEEGQPLVTLE
jgi:biotin carboxyl carrier protein